MSDLSSSSSPLGRVDSADLVQFPDARGGRKPAAPLEIEVLRPLTAEDLPALSDKSELVPATTPTLATMRHSHHQLARLIAQGTSNEEASLITGYDPAYISKLKGTPVFVELLNHYSDQRQEAFVDALERMKTLGLSALDELQRRLEDDPVGWSKRELMDMSELLLVKPGKQAPAGGAGGPSATGGVVVNVKFVSAPQPPAEVGAGSGPLIEAEVLRP